MKLKSASVKLNFLYAFLIFLASVSIVFSQNNEPFSINTSPLPAPTGFINDYAGVIDAATKQQLEQKIKDFKNKTNPQIELAVAIVKTTGERPIFDYSLAVARGWKIGSKADDNPSALLFIAIDDRKYFTQISKDLEDELPDGLAGQLQRQFLVPAFKQQNYNKGISDTIDAYIRTIESKQNGTAPPVTETPTSEKKSSSPSVCNLVICLIILFVILLIIFSRGGGKGGGRSGGSSGGGGFGSSALPWIIGSMIANSGSSSSSSSDWGGSSGGSDWGGFGGGGDFGGGGAGGDW